MKRKFLLIASGICCLAMSGQASLVAHYNFDEGAGATVAIDQLGLNNGAVGSFVTTGVAGVAGNAYSFTGVAAGQTNIVDMGNASFFSALTASGQLTYSAWVKTADTTGNRNCVVFGGDNTASTNYTDLGVAAGQAGFLGAATARNRAPGASAGTVSQQTGIYSPTAVNDNLWHNIVMTVNLSTATLSLYVDGVFANSQIMNAAIFPTFNNFEIGRLGRSAPTDPYQGLVDDVQVYDTALSASDVTYLFNNPGLAVPVPEPATLALLGLSGLVAIQIIRRKR